MARLLDSELAIVEAQYLEVLARRGRLEAERADLDGMTFPAPLLAADPAGPGPALASGQQQLFAARRDTLKQQLEQLDSQSRQIADEVQGIDAQITAVRRQAELIAGELADQRSLLARGLAQSARVTALEREAAQMEGQMGALQANRAAALTRRSELAVMKLRLRAERRERAEAELRELGPRELELAERRRALANAAAAWRSAPRSPASSTTCRSPPPAPSCALPNRCCSWSPGPPAADRRPRAAHDGRRAPPRAGGRASASPRSPPAHTPEIEGRLERISPDVLTTRRRACPITAPRSRSRPSELAQLGDLHWCPAWRSRPISDRRPHPMDYLAKPLTDYFTRAFREN